MCFYWFFLEREEEKEKHRCEKYQSVSSCTYPSWELNPKLGFVPSLGIKATSGTQEDTTINWATPARASEGRFKGLTYSTVVFPLSLGDTRQDPQGMAEISNNTAPCTHIYDVCSYSYSPMAQGRGITEWPEHSAVGAQQTIESADGDQVEVYSQRPRERKYLGHVQDTHHMPTQGSTWSKTYELFIPRFSHLIIVDQGWPRVTKTLCNWNHGAWNS